MSQKTELENKIKAALEEREQIRFVMRCNSETIIELKAELVFEIYGVKDGSIVKNKKGEEFKVEKLELKPESNENFERYKPWVH